MIPVIFEGFVNVTEGLLGEAAVLAGPTVSTVAQTALGVGAFAIGLGGYYLYRRNCFPKARTESQVLQDLQLERKELGDMQRPIIDWCKESVSDIEYDRRMSAAKIILTCLASAKTELDLSGLGLTSLPPNLYLPSIEKLFLQNNNLKELPANLYVPYLVNLDLHNNKLKRFSADLNLQFLRRLDLSDNELEELPADFDLPSLLWLFLQNNRLERLPDHFNFPNLRWLLLENNPSLAELPLSLATCGSLTELHIEGTAVTQAQADQILMACRNLRDQEALQALPHLLRLWSGYAEKSVEELQFIHDFSEGDKRNIHEWLVRLSHTKDFRGHQQELAKMVCSMLADLKYGSFKELFMSQVGANHEGCQDRSAMALNELFLSWKILVPQEEMTESDVIALLAGAGKTLALRSALSRMPEMAGQQESVEIYLYYETHLRERLGLLTAIQTMTYGLMGRRDWVDEEELVKEVEAHYVEEAIQLPFFEKLFSENPEAQEGLEKRLEEFGERYEAIEEKLSKKEINEGDYRRLLDQCMFDRAQASSEFKKNWFLSKLPSGSGH